ncbi:MAG TPA: VOC family protein [bacterium]|nr:VOC family protein [bacterium]
MSDVAINPRASVGHVRLGVADLGAMLEFYRGVLGLRHALTERDGTVHLSADGRYPFLFGLTPVPGASRPPRRATGLYHTAILVPSRAWLGRVLRHLIARGIGLDGASDHLVSEALYLRDPEGNGVELYADRPREAWPHVDGQVMMTSEPLDLDALIAEGRDGDAPWDGVPPDTRVGHVHLRVSALDRAEAFYRGVLGFDVTLRRYPGALFFSAGGYHHHLGTNVWGSAGAAPPPPNATGLRSFAVHCPDAAELARIVRNAERAHVQVEGAVDHGVSQVVTLRDGDGIAVDLTVDRPGAGDPGGWTQRPVGLAAVVDT